MKRLLLPLMLLVASLSTFAHDFEVDGVYYNILSKGDLTCEVTKSPNKNYTNSVVIPAQVSYNGNVYRVMSIGYAAFSYCSSLTSITLPNCVTSIGSDAFANCQGLTSITIPNDVTSIGNSAFYGCTSLTSVVFNARHCEMMGTGTSTVFNGSNNIKELTIGNEVEVIPDYAFYGRYGITSVTLPNSVKSIGASAFRNCSGITSITIPNSVTSIGNYAFWNCTGLRNVSITCNDDNDFSNYLLRTDHFIFHTNGLSNIAHSIVVGGRELETVIIPNSVTSIGDYTFANCSGLTSVTFPNSLKSIGTNAFQSCSKLTSITIPNSVTSIGGYSFSGCSGLTSITIPNSVTSIGGYAFSGCSSLTSITIPNNVTSIGDWAFSGCSGLTNVTIPNSVTSIGVSAFDRCKSLTDVIVSCKDEQDFCNYVQRTDISKIFNSSSAGLEMKHTISIGGQEQTSITIPNCVTSIGESAFSRCSGLTSITIPNSVTSIGDNAFRSCTGLTSITIPNSVTNIGNDAFKGCTSLPVIENLRYADSYIVEAVDKSLGEYKLKENTRYIGNSAFSSCNNLRKIELPKSLISIGQYAFSGCSVLSSLTVKALTPPECGMMALNGINKAACQLYVPYGKTTVYQAADQWKEFILFNELEKETEEDPDLEKPTIALENGLLRIRSNVKSAKRYYDITPDDMQEGSASNDVAIELTGVYHIKAYITTTEGKKSANATATLVWANPTLEGDGIMSMQMKKALLLRSVSGAIVVEGLDEGEVLELYNVSGMLLDKVKAAASTETLGRALQKGQTYIVKVGDRNVKYQF